jgi:4,5-DOPA dioxygenase extradiol
MTTQPILFVSHGSPMLALEGPDHPYARALGAFFDGLPEPPRAVVVISAHWQTSGPQVTTAARPGVLHDFSGFPRPLFELDYPAPGDPVLAERILRLLSEAGLEPSAAPTRPLDHGAWAVLRHLAPEGTLPVLQVSLPRWDPKALETLGEALAPLRAEGVLLVASGGLVHNLGAVDWAAPEGQAEPWAVEAEAWVLDHLGEEQRVVLADHRAQWPWSRPAAPTTDHFDPLFVARTRRAPSSEGGSWAP